MLKGGIRVEGHSGKWYVLNETLFNDKIVYLLEHETYGEDASHIIVDEDLNIIMEDVCNGFNDLFELEEI